jgi:hypothetical protein
MRCWHLPPQRSLTALATTATGMAMAAPRGVVATGLDNPRGIDVDRATGAIYVAEAGRGGSGPCITGGGSDAPMCLGQTGAITRIAYGHQQRVVDGLPSLAPAGGNEAGGPQDVDVSRFGFGSFITGLGANPTQRATLGAAGSDLASIFAFTPWGHISKRADLGDYEVAADPDKDQTGSEGVDSNPNSVLNRRGGYVAVDAGGNDLLRVRRNGDVSTIAVFSFERTADAPPFLGLPPGTKLPVQPVPTGVVRGPDGAYYVSELTGFPFPAGVARIYRVVPGSAPEIFADHLTNVTDLAFGRDGSLYAVEIAKDGLLSVPPGAADSVGALVEIARDGTRTTVADDLPSPYGVAIGRRGDIYVTTHSTTAGGGEVLRVR